ncbi:hypothetical protein WA026_004542 [Henosepilachna vigintioctopunctata]|uniref:Uncharacterized protein n=1 Tax=Henosepilachna vigintioctopunctata TaxID=420089 RepID=A0AAW1V1X8_9CUCU
MYRGFKQECPTGMVDEDSFKHIFAQFFPLGGGNWYIISVNVLSLSIERNGKAGKWQFGNSFAAASAILT